MRSLFSLIVVSLFLLSAKTALACGSSDQVYKLRPTAPVRFLKDELVALREGQRNHHEFFAFISPTNRFAGVFLRPYNSQDPEHIFYNLIQSSGDIEATEMSRIAKKENLRVGVESTNSFNVGDPVRAAYPRESGICEGKIVLLFGADAAMVQTTQAGHTWHHICLFSEIVKLSA